MEAEKKRKAEVDDDDDDGPPPGYVITPPAWESAPVAKQVQDILDAVDAPSVDKETRSTLQRYLWRRQKHGDMFRDGWGSDGRGYVTVLLRTILESDGNRDALIEPVVVAVSSCMRPEWTNRGLAWIEAFDRLCRSWRPCARWKSSARNRSADTWPWPSKTASGRFSGLTKSSAPSRPRQSRSRRSGAMPISRRRGWRHD
jgi:hypothetical protein